MSVEVEVFGQLSPLTERHQFLRLKRPVLVREVTNRIGLKPEEVGLITVDGVQGDMEDTVEPGCRLCFFPYMSGG